LSMAAGLPSAERYSLVPGPDTQMYSDTIHKYVSYSFTIVNEGARNVFIRHIGQSGPGLELLVPTGTGMNQRLIRPTGVGKTLTVRAHKSTGVTLWFQVNNCAKVPTGNWPIPLDASWGSANWQRVNLRLSFGDPVQWQKSIADSVCP
jgi:hypothetical protein